MKIKFKKLHDDVVLPSKTHVYDAGYDCVATSIVDYGDGRIEYGLGFAIQIADLATVRSTQLIGLFDLRPRSSVHKTGLMLANAPGTIDEQYTGEIKAIFYNVLPTLPNYKVGDRVCQILFSCTNSLEFIEVENLDDTTRGDKGFGSTGK
jgi:dUTP pyrophosphatase